MGLFKNFIGMFRPRVVLSYGGYRSTSAPFTGEAWDHDIFRATVDCIASHASKGQVKHIVLDDEGRTAKVLHNSVYSKLLNVRPNPLMTAQEFKYRLFAQLETQTTAIAYIKWNGTIPEMICPVDYKQFEIKPLIGGGFAIDFIDYEGVERLLPLEDCIVVRKFYCEREASGDGNRPIYQVFDMAKASDEGFIESLHTANKVRGIHKHKKAMLDDDDVKKAQAAFEARFKEAAENGGVISIDSMEEYTPIQIQNYSANATQMHEIANRIYTYLRTPEEIVQSKYSEHVGLAWYESKIEPMWQVFSEALTNACFTQREKDLGNRLVISGGVLMGTSFQTRINIVSQTMEIGLLTINEQRELLGYPPVEGGDIRQVSLNYINSDNQDAYQGGGTPPRYKDPQEGGTNE